jgi:hypothetical protein
VNRPAVPRPQPPIDRAGLLFAVADAASAAAAGAEMPESVRALDGRQFEVRIRFGCGGPTTELSERWLGWSYDPEARRIRVRALPTISSDDPLVSRIGDEEFEAVEGFWIPRPWLQQPVCPAIPALQRVAGGDDPAPVDQGRAPGQTERRETATAEDGPCRRAASAGAPGRNCAILHREGPAPPATGNAPVRSLAYLASGRSDVVAGLQSRSLGTPEADCGPRCYPLYRSRPGQPARMRGIGPVPSGMDRAAGHPRDHRRMGARLGRHAALPDRRF